MGSHSCGVVAYPEMKAYTTILVLEERLCWLIRCSISYVCTSTFWAPGPKSRPVLAGPSERGFGDSSRMRYRWHMVRYPEGPTTKRPGKVVEYQFRLFSVPCSKIRCMMRVKNQICSHGLPLNRFHLVYSLTTSHFMGTVTRAPIVHKW